ncbi:MAG: matrixin family metalloprotease [Bdellovibrionota bacterium]
MRIFLLSFFISLQAFAYQSSLNSGAKALTWPTTNIPLMVNPTTPDMASGTATTIIQNSVNEWNTHSGTTISTTNSALSEISFKSDFSVYGPGVIGVTELTYTSGGSIQQAKIYLNDDYLFRTSPGLYSSGEVFLGDVVTHELGHLFGLSHSEVLDSSMFYAAFPGQSTLSLDDKAGIRGKYTSGFGSISGTIKGGDDIGVFGVHVIAFSRKTGDAAGVFSDVSGNFSIKGLDLEDSYYLYTAPIKNAASLPGQFANIQSDFCPASFVGGFFNACGKENEGFPQAITLSSSSVTAINVGDVTINCSLKTNEDYSLEKVETTFDPVTIYDYAVDNRYEKAFVGNFLTRNSTAYSAYDKLNIDLTSVDISGAQKYLRLNFIARMFGNLLEYEMMVKRNGLLVGGPYNINYSVLTETYDTDISSLLPLSATASENFFEVSIRAKKLSTVLALQTFPEIQSFVTNQHLPYLLLSGLETNAGPILDTASNLSDNSSCLDAPFTYTVARARTLASGSEIQEKDQSPATPLSCGTTGGVPPAGGSGPGMMIIGFCMALVLSSLRKSAKNFLS